MRYQIESLEDFERALDLARHGDTIDGQGITLELKHRQYEIGKAIRIENIDFDKIWESQNHRVTFTISSPVAITECQFNANNHKEGLLTFIKLYGAKQFNAIDCDFGSANYAAIHAFDCWEVYVDECVFTLNSPIGNGYGIWQGGRGSAFDQTLKVTESHFINTRHAIAGHYNPNHIHVEGCEFRGNVKHVLDRHKKEPGLGGGEYKVLNCTFHDSDRRAIDIPQPLDGHKIIVQGNRFERPHGGNLKLETPEAILNETDTHPQLEWGDNYYKS